MSHENTNSETQSVKVSDALDKIVMGIGHVVMWANGILIFVIILQVILRYGFGHGLVVLEELQWHLYALGIMFGASYAMTLDSHIRVDIIHARLSNKWQRRWDLFGIFFLLLPFVIIIFHQSLDFVYESWRVNERSDAPLGLPFRWLIKGVIPASFGLLTISVISRALRIIYQLRRGE
ncbi:MAG: TRAP transporter small permease subunit [Desulfobacteraceae bacterium]|nr:MAG: TRAP transporter small permease subunit [Desulfobacteraceae bacterium]